MYLSEKYTQRFIWKKKLTVTICCIYLSFIEEKKKKVASDQIFQKRFGPYKA